METNKQHSSTRTIIIIVLAIVVVGLLARFVFFKDEADKWGEDLERLDQREQGYKADNTGATDDQVDAAFNKGMADMKQRKANYMAENPGATQAQADAALKAGLESMGK